MMMEVRIIRSTRPSRCAAHTHAGLDAILRKLQSPLSRLPVMLLFVQ